MVPKQGETSNPPQAIMDKLDLILKALKESNNRHESHETCLNAFDMRLTEFTERYDRFFTMWMAGQPTLAPAPMIIKVSNQGTTTVTPLVVPPPSLPPATFPAYVPPQVPNPQDQSLYNPFICERNYIQAALDASK